MSLFVFDNSSTFFWSSVLTVINSSLVDCNSSFDVSISSLVLCSSSLTDCNSSLVDLSSSLDVSISSMVVCSCALVDSSSSSRLTMTGLASSFAAFAPLFPADFSRDVLSSNITSKQSGMAANSVSGLTIRSTVRNSPLYFILRALYVVVIFFRTASCMAVRSLNRKPSRAIDKILKLALPTGVSKYLSVLPIK